MSYGRTYGSGSNDAHQLAGEVRNVIPSRLTITGFQSWAPYLVDKAALCKMTWLVLWVVLASYLLVKLQMVDRFARNV